MNRDSTYKRFLAGLCMASVLSGCTLIPALETPKPPVAENWSPLAEANLNKDAALQAANIHWKAFFTDEEMQRLVETALANNRDLQVAALRVRQMREQFRIQRAELLPNVQVEAKGVRQRLASNISLPGATGSFINEYYTGQVGASWTIDLFGRIQSLTKSALEQYFATEEAQRAVQVTLIAEVANAYLQLQADREILRLTSETLETQLKSFDLIKARYDNGIATQLDVSQAQMPVETARVNKALYSRLVEQDKNALQVLLGLPTIDHLLTERQLDAVYIRDDLPVGLPSEVLLLRPDIRRAEHELRAANANIGAARGAFFPSISLVGGYGKSSPELSDLFSGGTIWSVAPTVTLPIFEGGALWANLKATEAGRDIAVAGYEKAVQNAFREVADELVAKATLDEQLNAQRAMVAASQKAYDVSFARYQQGIDNFLTTLDAQRTLYEAQQASIETRRMQLVNLVNLYKVLGGGQQLAEDDAADAVPPIKQEQSTVVVVEKPAEDAAGDASAQDASPTDAPAADVAPQVQETQPENPAPEGEGAVSPISTPAAEGASLDLIRVDGKLEQQRVVYGL